MNGGITMLYEYSLSARREDFISITPQVREAITKSGVTSGIAVVYCPHTTAGITINENADPDVSLDLLLGLSKSFFNRCCIVLAITLFSGFTSS